MSTETKLPSYFEQRIYGELGITPEQNAVRLLWPAIHGLTSWHDNKLFDEDENGNIKIWYCYFNIHNSLFNFSISKVRDISIINVALL